jgi:outer membrane protein assembly factor BamB
MKKYIFAMVILVLGLINVSAVDWPQWRGANFNGATSETVDAKTFAAKTPLWRVQVGNGYSAVTVYQGKVFTAGSSVDSDTIYCLDANSGKVIWQYSYPSRINKSYPGTRATPVTDGKNVYMLSIDGDLICLNLADGKVVWEHKKLVSGGVKNLIWGISSSALLHNGNIYVNLGENGMVFDAATGKEIWKSEGVCNYSTPVVFNFNGRDLLAMFNEKSLNIIDAKNGQKIASYEWLTKYNVNAADPIIIDSGRKIIISSAYNHGAALLAFDGSSLIKVWESTDMCCHFSTPLLIDGVVYGVSGNAGSGLLSSIAVSDGKLITKNKLKFGNIIQVGQELLYLEENGVLNLINPAQGKCEVIASVKVISGGKCWTMPVLADGKIYCRSDKGELVCLSAK